MSKVSEKLVVYQLDLEDDGSPNSKKQLIRLPSPNQPYGLRIRLVAGSLAAKGGVFYTNYPVNNGKYERTQFNKVNLVDDHVTDCYCDIMINQAGAFEYYVEYDSPKANNEKSTQKVSRTKSKSGHFLVAPNLQIKSGKGKKHLPLDGIVLQSIVPKWLGPISQWADQIKGISQLGYNMLHFVPLQQRGMSNSPYSIFDQLALSDDLFEEKLDEKTKFDQLKKVLKNIEENYGVLGLTDVVYNHTANNSEWLQHHPEAGYNLVNSPHLIPAFEFDTALLDYSAKLSEYGIPTKIESDNDLCQIVDGVRPNAINKIKLWEFYIVDTKKASEELRQAIEKGTKPDSVYDGKNLSHTSAKERAQLLVKDALIVENVGARFGKKINPSVALALLSSVFGKPVESGVTEDFIRHYEELLSEVNFIFYKKYDDDVTAIINNIRNQTIYQRLDKNGPRMGEINNENPLIQTYFTRLPDNEITRKHPKEALALANNGWIWSADPLVDFASTGDNYLRREVIVWADCVKLRYGKSKEDNPWLWDHMAKYTESMATLFQGFRIDNCHSTPIHVAEYLLDTARRIRPDLYVLAELFTGSEDKDRIFVNRLGINSLIREAMQAWDAHELSRLVHRHGGLPVGSMYFDCLPQESVAMVGKKQVPCTIVPLAGALPHALFMDCTHDNETPNQKRMAEDTLPNAALVAMSSCSVGSVKGYDEIYPRLLDLVGENRRYEKLEDPLSTGIGKSKKILQELHQQMAEEGYKEVHVHHENQYVMVHRQHPDTHNGYFMIAHTAFANSEERSWVAPVKLRGTKAEVIFCHRLVVKNRKPEQNNEYLTGLETVLEELAAPQLVEGSDEHGAYTEVVFPENFTRGSVMLMKTSLTSTPAGIHEKLSSGIREAVSKLGLLEINVALYRCDQEERDVLKDDGTYNVPNYGQLPYSGLEGFMSVLKPIMKNSDLGHPFCGHLREGQWVLDYIVSRLDKYSDHYPLLKDLSQWFKQKFEIIRQFPNFLLPKYFASVLHTAYDACRDRAVEQMSPFVRDGDDFIKSLALTSVQLYGAVETTSLHPTKPGPCLAAGLPHFSVRHMRCWGRDVFIALRGLMMVTGNFEGAKEHILAFAGSLKHGQIPNLLDSLRKPRYNARDSTWWFLQAIQDYCNLAPNGIELLKESVPRRFPKTDEFVESDDPLAYSYNSTIIEVIQEILERHANGIHFREWNAGHNLDQSMSHEGFQVDITTDWKTGLIHGGSQYNCGTWMDKMGESPRAGTVGVPATPRDGATIEIIALLKSTLRWILNLSASGKYPHKGVQIQDSGKVITFRHWNDLIQKSFEEHFYVPLEETEDAQYKIDSNLVKRRGIYKDTYGSSKKYTDYDFRPNFSVAIIVAPELFNPKHALSALEKARETLMGPLGMRTLDPADNEYRGDYDNSNDSDDRNVARGFNYHQGPEWVWIFGYYLKAYFTYKLKNTKEDVNELTYTILRDLIPHKKEIETSKWAGIPELTNSNGSFCAGSCPTQAWSTGALLDVLRELALSVKN